MQETIVQLDDLPKLKITYELAVRKGRKEFSMPLVCGAEGKFLTAYAKYLIEYLESVSASQRRK